MMNDAEVYSKNNNLQKRDAIECLESHVMKIKWKTYGDKVLDIGCGDGSVTATYIKKHIPNNFKLLVGCDINENMVKYANEHHSNDKVTFTVLDIEGEIPKRLENSFDHVFSFYALHWIKNQKKAFRNIYNLLSVGGGCLLLFLGNIPLYDVYRKLAQHPKWSTWVYDVERFVSPYHDVQEPEKLIENTLTEIGFSETSVKREEKTFVFDNFEILQKAVKAVIPFKIPDEMYNEFMIDYLQEYRGLNLTDVLNNNEKVTMSYTLINVCAKK